MKTQIRNQIEMEPFCFSGGREASFMHTKSLKVLRKLQFLILALTFVGLSLVGVQAQTRYVATTGADVGDCSLPGSPCLTIQYAIDQAASGNTIQVAAGIYNISATIVVDEEVTINGPQAGTDPLSRTPGSAAEAIVDRGGGSRAFSIQAENVEINGLEITDCTSDIVETPSGSPLRSGITVSFCIIHNGDDEGVQLRNVANGGVDHCLVYDVAGDGINMCCGSTNSTISNNTITTSNSNDGVIYLYQVGTGMQVINNNLYGNTNNDGIKIGIDNGTDQTSISNAVVSGNTITDQPQDGISIYTSSVTVSNNTITGSSSANGALFLQYNISNITVTGNTISNNTTRGIYLGTLLKQASSININQNSIFGNTVGGVVNASTDIPVQTVNAQVNWWGDASGPGGSGPGTGNSVSTNVDFCPWLNDAPPAGVPISNTGAVRNTTSDKYFCNIQDAFNDAIDDDTLQIYPGTYAEDIDASTKDLVFRPGASPGCVAINNLTLGMGDALDMEIDGMTPCTGHDQFSITGSVTLNGADLILSGTYSLGSGDEVILIDNDGVDAVVGQFAQGTSIIVGPNTYNINYAGGDGNDVSLTSSCGNACGPNVFVGNVTISTQAQMNAFLSAGCLYTSVTGNLTINGDDAGDPIVNMCNLSGLQSVGNNLTIRRFTNLANPTNLDDLANLTSVGNNLIIGGSVMNENTVFTDINLPALAGTVNAVTINNNPNVTNISATQLGTVTNNLSLGGNNNSLVTISFSGLTSVGGTLTCNAGSSDLSTVVFSNLQSVDINLSVSGNNSTALTSLDFSSLLGVGNNLTFDNNDFSDATIDLSSLQMVKGNLNISDIVLGALTMDALEMVVGNFIVSSNNGLTDLSLAVLMDVDGDFTINSNPIATAASFPKLATVGVGVTDNFSMSGNVLMMNVDGSLLTDVAGNFTFSNEDAVTNFDVAFPLLSTVGGNFNVTGNNVLDQCCVAACQVVVTGSTNVSSNLPGGDCQNFAIAQAACSTLIEVTVSPNTNASPGSLGVTLDNDGTDGTYPSTDVITVCDQDNNFRVAGISGFTALTPAISSPAFGPSTKFVYSYAASAEINPALGNDDLDAVFGVGNTTIISTDPTLLTGLEDIRLFNNTLVQGSVVFTVYSFTDSNNNMLDDDACSSSGNPITLTILVNPEPEVTVTYGSNPIGASVANREICSGTMIDLALGTLFAGTEGTDYEFELRGVRYDNVGDPNAGATQVGYGPLTGGSLAIGALPAPAANALQETLVNPTTDPIRIVYQVGINVLSGSPLCEGPTLNINILVLPAPSASITPDPSAVCVGENLMLNGNPSGGSGIYTAHSWTGPGAASLDDPSIQAPTFNNGTAGTYDLTYEVIDANGCIGTDDITVTVNALPTMTCPDDQEVCLNDPDFDMTNLSPTPDPSGGSFTGAGVSGNLFSPSSAMAGTHTIIYEYTDGNGCTNSCEFDITVFENPNISITFSPNVICAGDDVTLTFTDNAASGQTFGITADLVDDNGIAVGGFVASGVTTGNMVTYTEGSNFNGDVNGFARLQNIVVTNETTNCSITHADVQVTVNPLPVMTCSVDLSVCIEDPDFDMTSLTPTPDPAGGTFSGTGVSGNLFSPNTAGVGVFTITYEYTDGNNCTSSCTFDITVDQNPPAPVGPDVKEFCVDEMAAAPRRLDIQPLAADLISVWTIGSNPAGYLPGTEFTPGNGDANLFLSNTTYRSIRVEAPAPTGTYEFCVKIRNMVTGCESAELCGFSITKHPLPDVSITFSPSAICPDEDVTLTFIDNAITGNTFSITADLVDDNGITVGGFVASGVSSGDMVTYTEGNHFNGDVNGFARLTNIVVTNETTNCTIGHSDVEVMVKPSPNISITFSPSVICPGEDVTLTFTDNAITGNTFSIIADLVDDNGTAVGGFMASGVSSGDMVTYTEGNNFNGDINGFARFTNIVVTNETTNCAIGHADVQVTVNPSPDVSITFSPSAICPGDDVTLTFTDNAASGQTFSVTANLVDDNGVAVGGFTASGVTTGDMATYTEGVNFDGVVGGFARLENIVVTNETTNCMIVHAPVQVTVNPTPATPTANTLTSEYCAPAASNNDKRIVVQNPGAGYEVVWILTSAPAGSTVFNGNGTQEFGPGVINDEFRTNSSATGNIMLPILNADATGPGTYVYGTWRFDVYIRNTSTGCESLVASGYQFTALENPAVLVGPVVKEFCENEIDAAARRLDVQSLAADLISVWTIGNNPAGYASGTEFTPGNGDANLFLSSTTRRSIRVDAPAPTGTYEFCVKIRNTVTGCESAEVCGFSITKHPLPDVDITLFPSTICAGDDIKLMFVDNASTGNTFGIVANLVDDNGTTVGGFTASGVSSGEMVTYIEGLNFDGDVGGFARLENIVVTNEATTCTITHSDLEVLVEPLPDVTVSFSPSEICPGEAVTLTFTDNSASGQTFSITADLVDDNGTTLGAVNFTGVTTGNMGTYTEGVDFDGLIGGFALLENILVTSETTTCAIGHADVQVTVNPTPNVSITFSPSEICAGEDVTLTFTDNAATGQTFSITADLVDDNGVAVGGFIASGVSSTDMVTYTESVNFDGDENGFARLQNIVVTNETTNCGVTHSNVEVTVHPLPIVTCPADLSVCADDPDVDLTSLAPAANPMGGAFSGMGVTGNQFSPNVAGVGVHTITYAYTDGNNCMNSCTFDITVNENPAVNVGPVVKEFCEDETDAAARRLDVQSLAADLISVWTIGNNPAGYAPGTEFTPGNGDANLFLSNTTRRSIRVEAPAPTGTYEFCVKIRNTVTGCEGAEVCGFSITKHPLPNATIVLSPTEICVGGTAMLTFTDNASTGHLFTITADLVDDNGTTVGALTETGVPSGASDTYTEGIDFMRAAEGTVSLININVVDETTNCTVSLPQIDLQVFADPVAPAIEKVPNVATVCENDLLTIMVTSPGSGGSGTCVDEYRFSTDNGANWSAWSTTLPSFNAVVGTNLIESRRICDGNGCDSNVEQVSWDVNEPIASLTITANPDGDLCIGTTGVQYEAVTAGGTGSFTFAWCAYNNGTGTGTCFNGFNNNAIQNPTRSWTSSTGAKSVGVTVSQAGCPDMTDLYAFNVVADPVAPTIVRNPDNDVCEGETITVDATPGTGGTGTCVDEYRFSTDNGTNWSVWSTTVPIFVAVEGVNLVESRRTCTGPDCNPNTNQVSWIVNPRPALQAELNGEAVTDNNDGLTDTGVFEVCDGVPGNVSITTDFTELNGVGGTIRVYQTVTPDANTTYAPWCNNCQATVSAFVTGTSATATLIDPTMPGSVVITFQVWADANNNSIIDPLECTGDLVEYTVTVNPNPVNTFRAAGTVVTSPFNETLDFDNDHATCVGGIYEYGTQAIAGGVNTVAWSISGGGNILQGANSRNVQVEWTTPGVHTLTFVVTHIATGCTSTNSLEVTVNPNPSDAFRPAGTAVVFPFNETLDFDDDHTACIGDVFEYGTLENTGMATSVLWTVSGGGNILQGATSRNVQVEWTTPGTHTLTFVFTFTMTGCTSTNSIEVTVIPNPVVTCPPNVTVECSDSFDPADTGEPTGTTTICCPMLPNYSKVDITIPGACADTYTIDREFTVEYNCGYVTTCNQTITVEDTTDPMITCPANTTIECSDDPSPANTGMANGSDNCDLDVTISSSDATTPGACLDSYTITRTWTAEDNCGHSVSCDQIITVEDTTDPMITCPANTTIECSDDPAPANTGMATGSDNCDLDVTISSSDATTPGACLDSYTITRTWTAEDNCGHVVSCDQIITVEDTTDPMITCPADITVECSDDLTPANTGMATGSDNCDLDVTISSSDATTPGVCNNSYTITRTWMAEDNCGHSVSCNQTITVEDTQGPVMQCNNITITPTIHGHYTLTQADIAAIGAGTTDNCGTVTFTVSQSFFNCADEGDNVITLTGTDQCSNSSSCDATITVNPFLTIVSCTATDETCAGAGDGKITIVATSLGGQIGFSVDGGANFQFPGNFTNLSAGTYTVLVRVFGIGEICEKTETKTINVGGAITTWYKDNDGDGYSDGPTLTSCIQPNGYIASPLSGTDCNDNNSDVYPGAPEICDGFDNNCDGTTPASEADADGDGYRICDGDCNDNPFSGANIHPGAVEICDGIDNNCDGNIDEGLADETYVGNIIFNTQEAIDAWPPCYSIIQGSVNIVGSNITNLGPLSNITGITGNLSIYFNSALFTLNGLDSLASVGGSLLIYYNFQLIDCCALDDLLTNDVPPVNSIGGPVVIFYNNYSSHCNSAAAIMAACPLTPLVGNPNSIIAPGGGEVLQEGKSMSLYPNPADQEVNVLFETTSSTATLRISDMLGRVVFEMELEEGMDRLTIDLNSGQFKNGLYLVSLSENGKLTTKQLLIQQ